MSIRTQLAAVFCMAGLFACAGNARALQQDASSSNLIPLKDFARHAALADPALSPDGRFLAVETNNKDGAHHAVVIYRLRDMKVASILNMPIYQLPANITWVSPTRLVIAKAKAYGSIGKPALMGEIIATDYDGKHQSYLYGYHSARARGRAQTRGPDEGFGYIAGVPFKHNNHFYMRVQPWNRQNVSMIYSVDAKHNTRHLVSDIQVGGMGFMINKDGQATYAYGSNPDQEFVAYHNQDGRWIKLPKSVTGERFEPVLYGPKDKTMYALTSPSGGPLQFVKMNADSTHRQVLAASPFSSYGSYESTPEPYRPFAVIKESGIPTPVFLNPNLPSAKLYRALQKAFPGQFVNFINFTKDGGKLLFSTSSDRNPGTYYLINTHTHKVVKLFDAAPWIHPSQMSKRVPFRFKASDGMQLEGILTMPRGRRKTNLPLILLPHGGPYFVRDDWFFESDAQMLASRGYLVLQVNYRGSSGRGPKFQEAGYRKWGTRIQQDLIDGVKWTIKHHYADPKRVCVYGASFGGYSALMTVIRAPHMFKCAIGYAGVYDLDMLFHKGDTHGTSGGRNYLRMVLGDNTQTLRANSPVDLVDKIHVPVFLVHGTDDPRAPYAGAKEMRDALEKAHKPFQWMAKAGEGHGFYSTKNNLDLFHKMFAFLKKNIGPGAPVVHNTSTGH